MDYTAILNSFLPFADELNTHHIKWAIGGSLLLALEGYPTPVHDIDILVLLEHHDQLLTLLESYKYNHKVPNNQYATTYFYTVFLTDFTIDILVDFKVNTKTGLYQFPFTKDTITKKVEHNNTVLYLSSIPEWQQAYTAMNRLDKLQIIEQHNLNNQKKL